MGAVGQDFVQHALNTQQPQQAIRAIQSAAALRDARAKPLLSLLDHMGVSRHVPEPVLLASIQLAPETYRPPAPSVSGA